MTHRGKRCGAVGNGATVFFPQIEQIWKVPHKSLAVQYKIYVLVLRSTILEPILCPHPVNSVLQQWNILFTALCGGVLYCATCRFQLPPPPSSALTINDDILELGCNCLAIPMALFCVCHLNSEQCAGESHPRPRPAWAGLGWIASTAGGLSYHSIWCVSFKSPGRGHLVPTFMMRCRIGQSLRLQKEVEFKHNRIW